MVELHFGHLSLCDRETLRDAAGRTLRQRLAHDIHERKATSPSGRLGANYWRGLQEEFKSQEATLAS
eukprot:10317372-Lingulodinium_polyedra.AAC.1